jgi:FKBP-type peptidyl-prolyl cis-trans isomerase
VIQEMIGASFTAGSDFASSWLNEGVVGMRAGGKRRFVMGSTLATGFMNLGLRCPSSMVAEIEVIS